MIVKKINACRRGDPPLADPDGSDRRVNQLLKRAKQTYILNIYVSRGQVRLIIITQNQKFVNREFRAIFTEASQTKP